MTRGETRVKYGPGDVVVRVRVDAVARFRRLGGLQRPRAPVADVDVGLGGLVGHGVGGVGVVSRACAIWRGEVAGGGDAGGRD